MPIQEQNIQFVRSEVMDDVAEGGGAATGNVVVDGTMNNVFEDISDLDRAYGRFNLRKLFVAVRTASTDLFGGARTVVTGLPTDDALSYTLFSTADAFDRRDAAASKVEAYLFRGAEWQGYLFEDHIVGMRSLQLIQRPSTTLPEQGQTLVLIQGSNEQYVRATRVTYEERTFTYSISAEFVDYQAWLVTVELSDALRYNFGGSPASRAFQAAAGKTVIRDVVVADATRYYGAVRLAQDAHIGDLTLRAESIFTRLVPSAQSETALVDRPLVGEVLPMVAAAAAPITTERSIGSIAAGGRYVLPTGCLPGSLSLVAPGGTITDNATGGLLRGGADVGSINYLTGELTLTAAISAGAVVETYTPAAGVSGQAYTLAREVTEATRSLVYVFSLVPTPAPGTLNISYMAQGKWYPLHDNGLGQLSGSEASLGTGTISYVTGSASVTLGALPDVGSAILVSWGTPAELVQLTTAALAIDQPAIEFDLAQAVAPGTLALSWTAGGIARNASADAAGVISGDATGVLRAANGTGSFRPAVLPDLVDVQVSYTAVQPAAKEVFGAAVSGGASWAGTLPNAPIKPGSLVLSLLMQQVVADADSGGNVATSSSLIPVTVRDDGAGGLTLEGYGALVGSSINYSTGAIVLALNYSSVTPVATYTTR